MGSSGRPVKSSIEQPASPHVESEPHRLGHGVGTVAESVLEVGRHGELRGGDDRPRRDP